MGEAVLADDGSTIERLENGNLLILGQWHRWFAWHPIWTMHAGWVWFRGVERQFSKMSRPTGVVTVVRNYRPTQTASHSRQGESTEDRDG